MWDVPFPLMVGGGGSKNLVIDSDLVTGYTTIVDGRSYVGAYDLYRECGYPTEPTSVVLTINSAAKCAMVIVSNDFASGSSVGIVVSGSAQVVGAGGQGGDGGYADDGIAMDGGPGQAGGAALLLSRNISLNIDDGYLYGGGGGGGGGAGAISSNGGSGGGGGRGFNNAPGGAGEWVNGTDGTAGSITAPGVGGTGAADGGAGGNWGSAGTDGADTGKNGGAGGAAGYAILGRVSGVVVTLTGAKNLSTLTSEGRLLGSYSVPGGSIS